MEISLTVAILLIVVFAALAGFISFLYAKKAKKNTDGEEGILQKEMQLLREQLGGMQKSFDDRLHKSGETTQRALEKQLESSQKVIESVTKELSEVKQIGKQTLSFTEQLGQLEKILSNPKQRGELGEYYLENILINILPPGIYETQYEFKGGDRVDAIIRLDDKILPVDAKFSLENYRRMIETSSDSEREQYQKQFKTDLKNRIDETSKYIKPEEGTMDFAFMFIPSETLYYDLLTNKVGSGVTSENLIEYAYSQKKVIIVSPTTFLAYLQTVLQGLKTLEIEKKTQDIIKQLSSLHKHSRKSVEIIGKMGNSLSTAVNHYNIAYKNLVMLDKDIIKITDSSEKPLLPSEIEKPL